MGGLARGVREVARDRRGASLDDVGQGHGGPFSLRWLLVDMVAEYARHDGHADLLRERIDGKTGH